MTTASVRRFRSSTSALLWKMATRDFATQFRGALLGPFWAVLSPLLIVACYTFVFTLVFTPRWPSDSAAPFPVLLFAGLIAHSMLAEIMIRSVIIITQNTNLVTKVVFPLWILPISVVISALGTAALSFAVLLVIGAMMAVPFCWTAIFWPIVMLPFVIVCGGLALALAALGVFLRDLKGIIPLVTTGLLFVGPVLYPSSALPEAYRAVLFLNPLTLIIEEGRGCLFDCRTPDFLALALYAGVAALLFATGLKLFKSLSRSFADVV